MDLKTLHLEVAWSSCQSTWLWNDAFRGIGIQTGQAFVKPGRTYKETTEGTLHVWSSEAMKKTESSLCKLWIWHVPSFLYTAPCTHSTMWLHHCLCLSCPFYPALLPARVVGAAIDGSKECPPPLKCWLSSGPSATNCWSCSWSELVPVVTKCP